MGTAKERLAGLAPPDRLGDKLDAAFGPEGKPDPTSAAQVGGEKVPDWVPNDLDGALAWLQAHLPRVAKGETAELEFKDKETGRVKATKTYQYADLTDVSEAVLPLLGRLGLSWRCLPDIAENGRLVMHYELKHIGGDRIGGTVPLPDRADPQAIGSHMTYWRRYLLCSVTGLAPGGDDDGAAAKAASAPTETLDEASTLSLPPAETERLVATLEPQALTPLAQYPEMWKLVTTRRAAGKPTPVMFDGKLLTWSELFGLSLAQRIDALSTPEQCRAFYEEAKAAGGDAALPWNHEGILPGARLREHGKKIKAEQDQKIAARVAALELAVAEATTIKMLDEAIAGRESLTMPDDRRASLEAFIAERRQALLRKLESTPEKVERQQAAASSWDDVDQQRDPEPAPEEDAGSDATGDAYRALGSAKALSLFAGAWAGGGLAELTGDLDGAIERDEISEFAYNTLLVFLGERPEPGPDRNAVNFLQWQAETAPNETALNELRDRVNALHSIRADLLDAKQKRELLAAIAARRTGLAELEGKRYR